MTSTTNHESYNELFTRFLTACVEASLNMVIAGKDPESLIDQLVALVPDDAVW